MLPQKTLIFFFVRSTSYFSFWRRYVGVFAFEAQSKSISSFLFFISVRRYTGLHDFVSFERTALMAVAVSYLLLVLAGLYNKKAKGFSVSAKRFCLKKFNTVLFSSLR